MNDDRGPERNKVKILIVEDSRVQAEGLKYLLVQNNYRASIVQNGLEALAYLKKQKPTLIISDILMPVLDGFELCQKVKADEKLHDIPIILLTSLSEPEDVINGLKAGADNFITKPYDDKFLLSRVNYVLLNQEMRKEPVSELGIEIFFSGRKHFITSNRMQILDLLLSTYENAVQKGIELERANSELRRTQHELRALNNELGDKVKRRTQRIEHLNLVLRAIRNVNQLIVGEKDPPRLLQGVCDSLAESHGFDSAWIAILDDEGKAKMIAEAGLCGDFLPLAERMKNANMPPCGQKALSAPGVELVQDHSSSCADCLINEKCRNSGTMTVRLEHLEKVYGFLTVLIPAEHANDDEEQSLFKEVAGDVAYALHNIELEQESKLVTEQLEKHHENLEQQIRERTAQLTEANERLQRETGERMEMQDLAIRHERLAALGQLAGGVSHELRNPLGAIRNSVYVLNMALENPGPEIKESLEILENEVMTSDRIISSLLDFARGKPADRSKVEVVHVLQEALSRMTIPEKVEVVNQLDESLPAIMVDPDQLGQIFGNLALNAFQAMPEGGRLLIESEVPDSEWVIVSFADTGVGIAEENLEKLFEPLFTTKARGIGLGLALVKAMLEANGGAIEVQTEAGKGATFTIKLPMDKDD